MASTWSGSLAVDGSGGSAQNFGALLTAAGYTGSYALESVFIKNSTATPLRVIQTNSNVAPASPSTKGFVVTNTTVPWYAVANAVVIDAGVTWLFSASAITIEVSVTGGGI